MTHIPKILTWKETGCPRAHTAKKTKGSFASACFSKTGQNRCKNDAETVGADLHFYPDKGIIGSLETQTYKEIMMFEGIKQEFCNGEYQVCKKCEYYQDYN